MEILLVLILVDFVEFPQSARINSLKKILGISIVKLKTLFTDFLSCICGL